MASRVSSVAEPMCGVATTFGRRSSGESGRQRLALEHVEAGGADPPLGQGLDQGRLVDHPATGDVDEDRLRAHPGELRGTDQAFGGGGQRQGQADEVGFLEQRVEGR